MSFSNPYTGTRTASELPSQPINMAQIGPIVADILRMKQNADQMRQANEQKMWSGIGSVVNAGVTGYQQGQSNDLANRAMYEAQNPNDPYTGQPGYDERVPDYGGADALKMEAIKNSLMGGSPLQQEEIRAKIREQNALANYHATGGSRGAATANALGVQARYDDKTDRENARAEMELAQQDLQEVNPNGIPEEIVNDPQHLHAPGVNLSIHGNTVTIPEGHVGVEWGSKVIPVPVQQLDQIRQAYSDAHDAKANYHEKLKASAGYGGASQRTELSPESQGSPTGTTPADAPNIVSEDDPAYDDLDVGDYYYYQGHGPYQKGYKRGR